MALFCCCLCVAFSLSTLAHLYRPEQVSKESSLFMSVSVCVSQITNLIFICPLPSCTLRLIYLSDRPCVCSVESHGYNRKICVPKCRNTPLCHCSFIPLCFCELLVLFCSIKIGLLNVACISNACFCFFSASRPLLLQLVVLDHNLFLISFLPHFLRVGHNFGITSVQCVCAQRPE